MIKTDEFYRKMVVFRERAETGDLNAREAVIVLLENAMIELGYGRGIKVFQEIRRERTAGQ